MAGRTAREGEKLQEATQEQDAVPRLLAMLSGKERLELENFSMEIGDLELWIPTGPAAAPHGLAATAYQKPASLFPEIFIPPKEEFVGRIREVRLGATKSAGGAGAAPLSSGDPITRRLSALSTLRLTRRFLLSMSSIWKFRFRKCSWRTLRM